MKQHHHHFLFVLLLACVLFFSACRPKYGIVEYQIRFTTDNIAWKKSGPVADTTYTGFGNYITSLTPNQFTSRIWTIGYIDTVMTQGTNAFNLLQYIDQNPDHIPVNDPSRLVDFSNNATVSFNPVIYGEINNDNQFAAERIDFVYFYFMPYNFTQVVSLPSQYRGIPLFQFASGGLSDTILTASHVPFMQPVFPNARIDGLNIIFGKTDSSRIVNPNGEMIPTSEDCPVISPGTNTLIIRSEKYSSMTYTRPDAKEVVTMYGEVSFDTRGLIQVYAGADNIPYNSDDVFVYAPGFWERISSTLSMR